MAKPNPHSSSCVTLSALVVNPRLRESEAGCASRCTQKKGTRESHVPSLGELAEAISSSRPSSRPSSSSPSVIPPFGGSWIASFSPHAPAHSAAWHVGPGVGDSRFAGSLPARVASWEEQQVKKRGCSTRAPHTRTKDYRFFAAFFAAFFFIAIRFLSSDCGDSASDGQPDRHNGWAEPSTFIPDVDYG